MSPSMPSVVITVLLNDGRLLCGLLCPLNGFKDSNTCTQGYQKSDAGVYDCSHLKGSD